tara:strand:+ start:7424 stop:8230 length:807 start_codon:yes stop_codon:yes gene_type:complete
MGTADTIARREPLGQIWGRSTLPALLGLVLPLVMLSRAEGAALWGRLALVLVIVLGLQLAFALARRHPLDFYGLVTAALIAIALPAATPLYQLILGTVFGVVIGEQLFGGRGRSFLHPAVVTLAFLTFSFADQDYRTGPDLAAWTLLPALLLQLASGQAAWRILLAAAGTMLLLQLLAGNAAPWTALTPGAVVLALLYLAADPVASASTNPGRWAYGALLGLLAGLFGQVGPGFGAMVFASLLGAIFAPLLDRLAILAHNLLEERRHG